jgi:hypothetical protein
MERGSRLGTTTLCKNLTVQFDAQSIRGDRDLDKRHAASDCRPRKDFALVSQFGQTTAAEAAARHGVLSHLYACNMLPWAWCDAMHIADYLAIGVLIASALFAAAMVLPRRRFPPPRL